MKDQFVKRFESLSEDFIYYMRSVEHLKDNTVQNYISWLKFLSESYPIDEKIEEKDIIKILFVGRLVEDKNVMMVLKALKELKNQNIYFDVVGDGMQKKLLEDFVRQNNLEKVCFRGKSNTPEDLKLVVTPSSGTYGASAFVTEEFHLSTTKAEETITSFNVTCPQASNIKKDIVDNYFVLTVPENKTTNNLEFSAMVTATTSGGYTLEATVPIKQAATSLMIPNTNYEVS